MIIKLNNKGEIMEIRSQNSRINFDSTKISFYNYEQIKVTQPNKPVADVNYMFFCVVLLSWCFYCHLKIHNLVEEQCHIYLRTVHIFNVQNWVSLSCFYYSAVIY